MKCASRGTGKEPVRLAQPGGENRTASGEQPETVMSPCHLLPPPLNEMVTVPCAQLDGIARSQI